MSEQITTNRSYNDFSKQAIYNNSGDLTSHTDGWRDDYLGQDATSTPINADNLNAMLQMLIDIRNVIGKTDDFAKSINGVDLYKTTIENGKEIEDIPNSVYPNPDNLDNRSIAKYLEAAFNAIIGSENDGSEKLTLNSIKNYLENLDFIDCGSAPEVIDDGGTN